MVAMDQTPRSIGAKSPNGSGLAAALGLHVEDLVADQPPQVVWAGLRFGRRCLPYWRPGDGSTTRLASSVLEVWQAPPRSVRRTSVTCHRRCGMVISMTTASPPRPTRHRARTIPSAICSFDAVPELRRWLCWLGPGQHAFLGSLGVPAVSDQGLQAAIERVAQRGCRLAEEESRLEHPGPGTLPPQPLNG